MQEVKPWYVYIVRCSDGTYYTGVALDPVKRLRQHNHGSKGAKYTRSRRPVELMYVFSGHTKQLAFEKERAVKRLSHKGKHDLVAKLVELKQKRYHG